MKNFSSWAERTYRLSTTGSMACTLYGVLQYVDGSRRVIDEARGVLRPTGEVIFMVYKTGFVDAFKLISKFMNRRFGRPMMAKVTE